MSSKQVSDDDLIRALLATKGDLNLTAEVVGISKLAIEARIGRNSRIAAAAGVELPVTGTEVETRTPLLSIDDRRVGDAVVADVVAVQEADLIRDGLKKAGIKDSTLEKLKTLSGLNVSGGRFLVASLDLAHRMTVYQSVALMEQAEYIKDHYLQNDKLTQEERYNWQRAYNEIAELIGKTFDRTLAGTQAMVAMMGGGKNAPKKPKPGPRPLCEAPPAEPQPDAAAG